MLVIGVDCATDDARIGLARGEYQSGALRLDEVHLGSRESPAAAIVTAWLRDAQDLALLAMDAPFGWPAMQKPCSCSNPKAALSAYLQYPTAKSPMPKPRGGISQGSVSMQ